MEFKIPETLKAEHEGLHVELAAATKLGGKIGEAAEGVARVMHPHFVKEEEFAQQPLSLLPLLAAGKVTPEMAGILPYTDRVKAELPEMLDEHKAIVAALQKLAEAARKEKKPEFEKLAEDLTLHAKTEEEVLYPAAILVGEYVRLKLGKS